ncbi:LytTR family DNA-binding domain-containing protein [Allokutzneria sp. NRRL B-24872]|uniref:LytR/AlgR family response regulator transcription factor n=1 Tax=Allokutzneria sp. NRRL B-24872 TaxID=1137961 RepID=UPI001FEF61FC|nr:LytTR family DNA-binding domain-containing protein [Allokutzneria sp. NRRL B-24872]
MSTNGKPAGLIVLAIDDEPNNLDEIGYLLDSNPRVRRVLLAGDATEALSILRGADAEVHHRLRNGIAPVDAVFADIQMPGLSGMELARLMVGVQPAPALVFITGFEEYALGAYELGALDYIVKPPREDRIERVLGLVERTQLTAQLETAAAAVAEPVEEEVIPVELAGTTKLIPRSSVRWVEAQGDYARLHTSDGSSHLVRIPLAQLEEKWADAGFVRIHRSYLVALPLITELKMVSSGYTVRLGNEAGAPELPVSRRHTRELKDRLVRAPKNNWGQR